MDWFIDWSLGHRQIIYWPMSPSGNDEALKEFIEIFS